MKAKNKGRKIYKTKEKNYYGKSGFGKIMSAGLTILLIGGIGFIGYSVAEPIINFSKKKGDQDQAASSPPPIVSETAADTTATTKGNGFKIEPPAIFSPYHAAALKDLDLVDLKSIKAALNRLPTGQNIEYIEVPLKVSGGAVNYASSVYYAAQCQSRREMLSLRQIYSAVKESGYEPVAIVSTFCDHKTPVIDGSYGYRTDESDEQWIDDDVEQKGKPWTTPYSSNAVMYNASIIDEITDAGFKNVVCSDLVFPHFRPSDLEILPHELSTSNRSVALTAAANLFNDRIISSGGRMFIEVSAAELIAGYKDILQPMLLNVNTIVLNIDLDEIGKGVHTSDTVYEFKGTASEKTKKVLEMVGKELEEYNLIIRLSGTETPMKELLEAKDDLASSGIDSFVIG